LSGTPQSKPNPNVKAANIHINADRRLNAVIINDLATKMPMYASLISALDKPLAQVEINVSMRVGLAPWPFPLSIIN
jgi:type II secretory pathway component GspD/PulD (secretin)